VITKLEARINIYGGREPCTICHRFDKRRLGMTEIYSEGTEDWVCADCGNEIDPELSRFAYFTEHPGTHQIDLRRSRDPLDGHLEVCPECGACDRILNLGWTHWCLCLRHGLCWYRGYLMFDGCMHETAEKWRRNLEFLKRFREATVEGRRPVEECRPNITGDVLARVVAICKDRGVDEFRWHFSTRYAQERRKETE
jgi:hypothetical protein